jgi:hypothetical protein
MLNFHILIGPFAIIKLLISFKGIFWLNQIWIGSDSNNATKLVKNVIRDS